MFVSDNATIIRGDIAENLRQELGCLSVVTRRG